MKRIISILLCIVTIFSTATVAWANETGFNKNLELDTVRLLQTVGILAADDEFVEKEAVNISRGEMARLLVCAMGYGETASKMQVFENTYSDVKTKTKYANEIIIASKLGLFGEKLPRYFYPETLAETDWAVKAVTRLLGYTPYMKKEPKIGYRLGLADGIETKSRNLSRVGALQLLKNALEIPLLSVRGVSGDSMIYSESDNRTLLSEYFGIYTQKGCLTADKYTAIKGEITEEGEVCFDGYRYLAADGLETKDLVGNICKFYVKKTKDRPIVVYIEKQESKEIKLYSKNMEYKYADNCYYIEQNGRTKKLPMDINTMVSYNGTPHFDKNKMHPLAGHVVLIDNDMDGVYEVCKIREYRNVVVKSCDTEGERIFDEVDQSRNIVFENYDEVIIYSESGEKAEIKEITPGNVLTVYESIDKDRLEIYITSKSIARHLDSINTSKRNVTVEGREYVISDDCRFNAADLKPGQMYYFYINYWNEIVYIKDNSSYFAFWFLDAEEKTEDFQEKTVKIKGLSETGEVMCLELAKRVVWNEYGNNRPRLDKSVVYGKLETSNVPNRQLLKLMLNDAGQVCEVVVAYDAVSRSALLGMSKDHPLIKMSYIVNEWPVYALNDPNKPEIKKAYNYGEHYGHWLFFDSNAIEFQVETNATTGSYTDDDMIITKHSWHSTTLDIAKFDIYMSSKENVAAEYSIKNLDDVQSDQSSGYYFTLGLVVDVETCLEEETGDIVSKLTISDRTGWISEKFTTSADVIERQALIAAGATLQANKNSVESGDIILYNVNKNDKIDEIRMIYDASNDKTTSPQTSLDERAACTYGKVLRSKNGYMEYGATGAGITAPNVLAVNIKKNMIEYDKDTQKVRAITPDELYIGDDVVVISRYRTPYMTVVFRGE